MAFFRDLARAWQAGRSTDQSARDVALRDFLIRLRDPGGVMFQCAPRRTEDLDQEKASTRLPRC
jgi:hypothetical protein